MIRFLRSIFLALLAVAVLAGIIVFSGSQYMKSREDTVAAVAPSQTEIPSLDVLLVQVDEQKNERRILACGASGCTVQTPPDSAGDAPLSDGTTWYRFAQREDKKNRSVTVLEKVSADGATQKISEENELVRPRAMSLSTDGTKLAYFLDNKHDKENLTELWVYDSVEGGAKVAAENLHRMDIASRLRWNASSRVAWFLQDGAKKQFMTVPLYGKNAATPRFDIINWNDHASTADTGTMDVSDDEALIAFSEKTLFGFSRLVVAQNGGTITKKTLRGNLVYVRWMENNALLYAVQDGANLSFLLANSKGERPVARMSAQFKSARSSGSSNFVAFVADPKEGESHIYVLQISTGQVKDQATIPPFSGSTYLVQASEAKTEATQAVSEITSRVEDGVLLAFVQNHGGEMASDATARATRVLTTDSPNTIYVDYTRQDKAEKRMLVVIKDVIHPEWEVLAHYIPLAGQWRREQEAVGADPKVTKLYEWEEGVSQWILKERY